jgi:hypothetical protein
MLLDVQTGLYFECVVTELQFVVYEFYFVVFYMCGRT